MLDFLATLPNVKPLDCDDRERGLPAFACNRCHRIRTVSFTDSDAWNRLVSLFSGGLLSAKDVPRPDWFPVRELRKVVSTNRNCAGRRTSPHRPAILKLLLETDDSCAQISRQLLYNPGATWRLIRDLYKENGVSTREELRAKLTPKRESA